MLTIHHSTQSRSLRVVWLCEELGIPYELRRWPLFGEEMKRPDYLAIHPLGKVPAIEDDGFVLWETTAILQYLVARYSDGALCPPAGTSDGARQLQWLAFGENPLTVIMGEIAAHGGARPEDQRIPALVDRGREMAAGLVEVVEHALGDGPFILGSRFSAADIMLAFGLMVGQYVGYVGDETPRARDYCERLLSRPAYQRALAVDN